MKIILSIYADSRIIEEETFYGVDALHAFISGEVKSEPPNVGELSRRLLNSPDGFVSLRDRDADSKIYDMYVSH